MSRKILRATCSTLNPSTGTRDWVNFLENAAQSYDPARLTVFVGERAPNNKYSALASTGGLAARQLFKWENYPTKDLDRYFVDFGSATVTLKMILQPKVGTSAALTTTFTGQLPSDSMAVNLDATFGQGAADNMMNEDCWGRLVYYDTGALGQGITFSPADYVPQGTQDGRGIFMNGGILPDFDDSQISLAIKNMTPTRRTPSANFQMGRDQSVLAQSTLGNVQGISGYWSLGVEPVPKTATGNILGSVSNVIKAQTTNLTPWMHFGTPSVGYPSTVDASSSTTSTQYWQAVNPMYGRSATGGAMRPGNCLAITPSTFMTDFGYKLLSSPNSNPNGASTLENKRWTTYFSEAGTSFIQLSETQPLGLPVPAASGPLPLDAIPNINLGLYMMVPITRVLNGITIYTDFTYKDVTNTTDNDLVGIDNAAATSTMQGGAKGFYQPARGLMYVWYDVQEVRMTINVPAYRIDSVSELNRFFGMVSFNTSLVRECGLWLKWSLSDGAPLSTTMSLLALSSLQQDGDQVTFNLTARDILQKATQVFEMYGITQTQNQWPTNTLSIHQVLATCTTKADLFQLYSNLFTHANYLNTPAGVILAAGGTKTFTRLGPNLSGGAPSNMTVALYDIVNGLGEVDSNTGKRFTELDALPQQGISRFQKANDFLTTCPCQIAGTAPQLRIPNLNVSTDMGGTLTVSFNTSSYLNLPWCGPQSSNQAGGGPGLTGFTSSTLISESKLQSYSKGWFNNLNPFSPDYEQNAISSGTDTWSDLDTRLVNLNARTVEVWVQIGVEIPVYTTVNTTQNTTADDKPTSGATSALYPAAARASSTLSQPAPVSAFGLPVSRISIPP